MFDLETAYQVQKELLISQIVESYYWLEKYCSTSGCEDFKDDEGNIGIDCQLIWFNSVLTFHTGDSSYLTDLRGFMAVSCISYPVENISEYAEELLEQLIEQIREYAE